MVYKARVLSLDNSGFRVMSLLLLIGLFFLLSCTTKPQPILRVATNVWPGYEPLYLARSLGLYAQTPIRLVEMTSASQVSHAIRNGTVEVAALTLDETLSLIQDPNLNLRVILVMDISNGADVLLARDNITNLAALRGKRIGVENNATGAIVFGAALESVGLATESVNMIPLTINDHLPAWNNNQIDALVTFEPVRSQLLNMGARELFDSSQIPGRILDVLVVRADVLNHHDAALKALIAGYFAALEHMARHPDDAAVRMAGRLGTPVEQVLPQFKGLRQPDLAENWQWLSGAAPGLQKSAAELSNVMLQHQLLQHDIAVNTLAEAKYLPAFAR